MKLDDWTFDFKNMTGSYDRQGDRRKVVLMKLDDVMYISHYPISYLEHVSWGYPVSREFGKRVFNAYMTWCLEQAIGLEVADET